MIVKADDIAFTLADIRDAHKAISQTANFIADNLLYGEATFNFSTAAFDLFLHMDRPWIHPKQKEHLHKLWDQNQTEIDSWTGGF